MPNITPPLYYLLLFLSSYFGCIFLMGPLLWLIVSPRHFRRAMDALIAAWLTFAAALMELLVGLKFRHHGDTINKTDCAIIIMNHPSRLDWMYIWYLLMRFGCLTTLKIVMKQELKGVPGPGWAMQAAHYMFLKRSWDIDGPYISQCVEYFAGLGCKNQYLIFPEGTNLTPQSKRRCDEYAERTGLEPLERLLQPRTLGFVHLRQQLGDRLDAVYDLTLSFDGPAPSTELQFARGQLPGLISWRVRRYPAAEVPADPDAAADWLRRVWREKDTRLAVSCSCSDNGDEKSNVGSGDRCRSGSPIGGGACDPSLACRCRLALACLAWLAFIAYCLSWLASGSCLAWAAFVGLNAAFAWMSVSSGGVDAVSRRAAAATGRRQRAD